MARKKQKTAAQLEVTVKRLETMRMWLIVLAAGLLIGGYVSSFLPVLYGCTLPLGAAALITWRLKYLERDLRRLAADDASETEQTK